MIRIVTLDAIDYTISGQYNPGDMLVLLCDATLNAFTAVLPDAASLRDVVIFVKKIDSTANVITLSPIAGQNVDGATSMTLESQYESEILVPSTANYYRFANSAFV
jgi:hypothetical protein